MSQRRAYGTMIRLDDRALATRYGNFRLQRFRNLATRTVALAAVLGDVGSADPVLARVHSSCVTSESYGACDCDCAEQLAIALEAIARAGRGVLFYLMQEGRGAGFAAKARDRMLVQASGHRLTTFEAYERMGLGSDHRRYDEVVAMCRLLGVSAPLRVLSNNPDKVAALEASAVRVDGVQRLEHEISPFARHYMAAKQRSGHRLAWNDAAEAAELPEPVQAFDPHPLVEFPQVLYLASYLLPVRLRRPLPCWFRLHAYLQAESGAEHVVLTHGAGAPVRPLASVQRETLEDRFPVRAPSASRLRWERAVERIAAHGAGCVLFESVVPPEAPPDPVGLALLARHAAAP